jgi:hypothetical protein
MAEAAVIEPVILNVRGGDTKTDSNSINHDGEQESETI